MRSLVLLTMLVCLTGNAQAAIPAFPGAGGGGAASVGGRGGAVLKVTNLNDDGPGSLRAACLAEGPRTVVFRLSGIITLKSTITIANPFITIAGQTAPAGGILLTNATKRHDGIVVTAHDVIIRFLRVRDTHDGISIKDGAYNVVIDHCSLSWGRDENMSVNLPSHDITFSWVLNAECLMPHSCGITHDNPNIFIRGNKGPNQSDPQADNWGMMERLEQIWVPAGAPPGRARERKAPQARSSPITVEPVAQIERLVPADVGASRRLDQNGKWVPSRDSVDERLIREYLASGSKTIASPKEVGGMPAIPRGEPWPDSDHDGMPDAWEESHGLDPRANDSAGDQDGDGYTNLEEFLNSPPSR